jgi:serine/threonine protein kinase/sugar lactone lactonase YvrE
MNRDRWRQIDELLDAVLEMSENERAGFLAKKCGRDVSLKREVLSLLEAQRETERFMENSAMNVMAKELAQNRTEIFSLIGKEFGTYKIEKPIGAGGMGEIYLAYDSKLNRKVALKILPAEYTSNDERLKRFELEARAISCLNHPNIVTIYDVGNFDGINYIATEFIAGETVRDLINRRADLRETLSVIGQACEALAAAHDSGIIHRDIKPENIMVRPDGYVKVLDFGLAKLSPQPDSVHVAAAVSATNHTQKGTFIGTLAYMSPEQIGDDNVGYRTDLWSLGVVFYEMLTGANPFKGENRQATMNAILNFNPPPVSESNPALPAALDRILEKALEKDAEISYQTASDFCADLKRARREFDSSASLRSNFLTARRRAVKTKSDFLLYVLAFLLVILSGFGIWYFAFRPVKSDAVDWSKATNVHLTDQAGTEFYPSLAPDGKSFVYSGKAAENYDLYAQRIGGKNPQNLTADSAEDDKQPAFSPDGLRIAFRSERQPRGVYVMEATGENVRRVADFGFHPSWSPDGKEIVVSENGRDFPQVRNNTPSNLWRVNVATGEKRRIYEGDAEQPAWSPGGERVAFVFMQKGGRRDIATIPADGSAAAIVVTKDGSTNWCPVWSPDGKFLYYASDKNGNMNFWRVRLDEASGLITGEPEAVVAPSKYSHHLAFSGDGKRLIYVQTDRESNIYGAEFDAQTEKTIGEPFAITRGTREIGRARLSPDGKQFVVRLPRSTQDDIAIVSRDGKTWRDLTNDTAFDRYARWSPDGKRIAFASDRSGNYEIWMIDADGTNLRQITFTGKVGTSFPLFSPDGTHLIYDQNRQTQIINLTANWSEQTPQILPPTNLDSNFVAWDWSPDGKKLAGNFGGNKPAVGFYSFETNRYEKVADGDVNPVWLPDSRRFVFPKKGKAFIADTITKKTRELFSRPDGEIFGIGVDENSRLLYFTLLSTESDIWLLDVSQNQ